MKQITSIVIFFICFYVTEICSDDVKNQSDTEMWEAFRGRFQEYCGKYKCLHKCCPDGQNIIIVNNFFKKCARPSQPVLGNIDFSDIPLYHKNFSSTGKSLKDVYRLVPGIMLNEKFNMSSYDYASTEFHQHYMSEESILWETVPNQIVRKHELTRGLFCVDYQLNTNYTVLKPSFWTVLIPTDIIHVSHSRSVVYNITGLMLSCFFLALVLVIYSLLPDLHTLTGMILMAYVASMFCSFLFLAIVQMEIIFTVETCLGLSYSAYFFTIAAFCWMTVMSYDFWSLNCKRIRTRNKSQRSALSKFKVFCAYAWGIPAALTIFVIVVNHIDMKHIPWFITPNIPRQGCFIAGGQKLLYLYVPMLILIITNWVFFLLSSCSLWREYKATSMLDTPAKSGGLRLTHRSQKNRFLVYLKLSVIMGISWVLEVVSSFHPEFQFWYITDFFNMLVGFSIFLIFVCNKKVYKKLLKKFNRQNSMNVSVQAENI